LERESGSDCCAARCVSARLGAVTREDVICITGSFYLVAEAIRRYRVKTS
jgi:folylpolyglutamate synthase/dihydropteroate synthase